MKKIIVIAGMALMGTGLAFAQGQQKSRMTRAEAAQKAEMRAMRTADRMQNELQLTSDQRNKVYNIVLENNRTKAVNGKASEQQIRSILTPSQVAKMDQLAKDKMMIRDASSVKRQNALKSAPMKAD